MRHNIINAAKLVSAGLPKRLRVAVLPALAALLVAPACADADGDDGPAPAVRVVATTSFIADWARSVGGERVEVFSLSPVGGDPHGVSPGARDVARVADADIVLSIGLGLEERWLQKLIANASADPSRVVALGLVVDPLEADDTGRHEGEGGPLDPHFWFDPLRVKLAVSEIAARLSALDPAAGDAYRTNAAAYGSSLDELHAWIQEGVARIPPRRRLLLTSHESLRYLADRYGFEVVGAVIPGITTETEPSAKEITALVAGIQERGVLAVFTEASVSDRLVRAVAEESGVKMVRDLYTGSLGEPGSGAETYIDMMRANVETIVEALR